MVKTGNPKTLLDLMHELGQIFFCNTGDNAYKIIYFAQSREIHFEGTLTEGQLQRISADGVQAKSIGIDEFNNEIIIEE